MARPTKLTPAIERAMVEMVKKGVTEKTAARAAGIAERTHHDWMERGQKAKSGIHRDYFDAIDKARAEAEVTAIKGLLAAGKKDWRAYLAYLERTNPQEWARLTAKQRELAGVGAGSTEGGADDDEPTDDQAGL
jgi:transposase